MHESGISSRGNSKKKSSLYLVHSPQSGRALSHRRFWVLHRVQAFLAIKVRRSRFILLVTESLRDVNGRKRGDWRGLEGSRNLRNVVRAGFAACRCGRAGWGVRSGDAALQHQARRDE